MPHKKALFTIFLVVFLDLVGFGIVIPILPYYAREFGASAWQLGWLMTAYSLMQFLFAPVWGRISDRYGRRPVLLVSILASSICMNLLGMANTLAWLFVARLLAGAAAANISTAYAYVADITTEENRAKGMGLIGAGFGLGFIFGPAIGGVLSAWGYATPMFFAAGLSLLNFFLAYALIKEPATAVAEREANRHKRFDWRTNSRVLEDRGTRLAILLFLIITFAVTQMEVSFALFLLSKYQLNAREAGLLLGVSGLVMVSVQGGFIGKLSRRFGEQKLVLFGTLLCAFSLVLFAATTTLTLVVAALVGLAFGHGLLHPSLSSLASFGAPKDLRGATMGVFQSAGALARVLGPPCAGFLFDAYSREMPFYSAAVVLAGAFLLATLAWKSQTVSGADLAPSESRATR